MMKYASWLIGSLLCIQGCVEKTKGLTPSQRERLHEYVSPSAPAPQHRLEVEFDKGLELLGYDVDPERWVPGRPGKITWYWKASKALPDGWAIFTHLSDATGGHQRNLDSEGAIRGFYPPSLWKIGEYVRDEQTLTLDARWNAQRAVFHIGVWRGNERLRILKGSNDGDNRVRAASIPVDVAGGVSPPPQITAARAEGAITIDGQLDETSWTHAATTPSFVNTMTGAPAEPRTHVRLLWDDAHLYVAFDVRDKLLKSSFEDHDDHLWEQDCVEIMVDPNGDARTYFEMQVSPASVVFDTRYDAPRDPPAPGHVDWNSALVAKATTRGTVNDDNADEGYTVEIAIPWSAFAAGPSPASPAQAGQAWRINFFVMDTQEEGQRAAGWSPPRRPDFHTLDRFGTVRFAEHLETPKPQKAQGTGIRLSPALQQKMREELQAHPPTARPGTNQPQEGEIVPTRENPNPAGVKLPRLRRPSDRRPE